MAFWGRIMHSVQAGIDAYRRFNDEPVSQTVQHEYQRRLEQYQLYKWYFENAMFDRVAKYGQHYKAAYGLYDNIAMIYNPFPRIVRFNVSHIWSGPLSTDGNKLSNGMQIAVPFSEDTSDQVKLATAQLWQWSNFLDQKATIPEWAETYGNCLVEIIDDLAKKKVYFNALKPEDVYNVELDPAGNVKSYALQYRVTEQQEQKYITYVYKKEVDGKQIRHYRDDQLEQVIDHPYTFCPAVWFNPYRGRPFGPSVIAGNLVKVDKLNSLVSHIDDEIHVDAEAPAILWGGIKPSPALLDQEKRNAEQRKGSEEKKYLMYGPLGGRADSMSSGLDIAKADIYIGRYISELESTYPMLRYYELLQKMSNVTGPGALRLSGDVAKPLMELQCGYDQQLQKLFQMGLTIAGHRANEGAWGTLNRQQSKFLPFTLDSYERGDLDFSIMPRVLLEETGLEKAMAKQTTYNSIKAAGEAGIPLEIALEDEGYPPEKIARIIQAKEAEDERNRQAMMVPDDELPMDNEPEEEDNDDA